MSCELSPEPLADADMVLFHTSHSTYDAAWLAEHSRLIFDTRNYFKGVRGPIVTLRRPKPDRES
jgi:UDP-N-acetyl-D-glucosamine dehydrogenase